MGTYALLVLAIAIEVGATVALKASHGMTRLIPAAIVVTGYAISFFLVSIVLKRLDLGLVYATWSAVGTAAIAVIGIWFYDDAVTPWRIGGLLMVVLGVVMLNLSGGHAS